MKRLLLPMLCFTVSSADARSVAIKPGDGFEVQQYAVMLRPDLATTTIAGTETVVVRATADQVKQLAFPANALRISEATVNARPVQVTSSKHAIVFTLPRSLRKGNEATLHFRIDGIPARGVTSLAGGGLYTSYFACDWMVCLQDSLGDKAHLALDLFLPGDVQSVGVGLRAPTTVSSDGLVLHRWRPTRPYSPYLYAFAVGPFVRHANRTAQGDLFYFDATGTAADLQGLFAQTPAMAAFFANKAGDALAGSPLYASARARQCGTGVGQLLADRQSRAGTRA